MRDVDPIEHLQAIDGVEQPDPAFAAKLLDRLHEEMADSWATEPLRLVETSDSVDLLVPEPAVARPKIRRRTLILELAAVAVLVVGGVFAIRARAQEVETVSVDTAEERQAPVGDGDPSASGATLSLVELLENDGRFGYMAALLEIGTPGSAFGDCSLSREFTVYAHTDASIDAFLSANDLEAAALFADPNIVGALLADIVVEGVIPPSASQSGQGGSAPLVAGEPIGFACNGVAYDLGSFWVPSDAATVALLDVGPELESAEAIAESFMVARRDWDGAAMRLLVADDALIRGEVGPANADSYVARSAFELATGTRIVEHDCAASTPQLVRCTYELESALGLAERGQSYLDNLVILTIQGGEIQQVVNSTGNNSAVIEDGEAFRSWLEQRHPGDLSTMMSGEGSLLSEALVLTDEAITLWQLRLPKYIEG